MTPKQYMAILRRTAGCPSDTQYQTYLWPYPQAKQSHMAIYRESWDRQDSRLPEGTIYLTITGSDNPGVLVQIAPGSPTPSSVIEMLREHTGYGTSRNT